MLKRFLINTGISDNNTNERVGGFLTGLPFVIYFFLLIFKWDSLKRYPVLLAAEAFILLSAVVITYSRVGFGVEVATADRYRLLTSLFLGMVYLSTMLGFESLKKWIFTFILAGSVLFYGARVYYGFYKLDKQKTMLVEGIKTFNATGKVPETLYPDTARGTWILKNAIEEKIYNPPY